MLSVSCGTSASPEVAWAVLARPRHWVRWGPSVRAVEVEAAEVHVGLRGRVQTVIGMWVPFEVTDVVDGVSWRWRVGGVRATGHRVEVEEGETKIVFEVPVWAAPYAIVCTLAARRVARLAERLEDRRSPAGGDR